MSEWELLAQSLREELQEQGALLTIFREQQEAILQRQPDLVLSLSEAINGQVEVVRQRQKQRRQATRNVALQAGQAENASLSQVIAAVPAAAGLMLQALATEVNRLIKQTKRRAEQNQMLLARTIEISQAVLERLSPGTVIKTYSRTGQLELGATGARRDCVARS